MRDGRGEADEASRSWAGQCEARRDWAGQAWAGRCEAGVGGGERGRGETGRAGQRLTSRVGQARRRDEVAAGSRLLEVAGALCGLSLAPSRSARSLGQPAGRGRAARRAGQIWGRLGASGTAPRAARAGRCRLP